MNQFEKPVNMDMPGNAVLAASGFCVFNLVEGCRGVCCNCDMCIRLKRCANICARCVAALREKESGNPAR